MARDDEYYEAEDYNQPRRKGRRRKRSKNKAIVFLGAFFTGIASIMLVYICWYSYANRVVFVENKYNQRASQLTQENTRGSIISSDNQTLACTETAEDGTETRSYPFGAEFSHVVGYSVLGGSGIEDLANYYLINCNAALSTKAKYSDSNKKFPGDNVYTTIDSSLQRLAYYSLGDYNGAVIISDPKTGAILAMVSKPDFDPNTIKANWDSLSADNDNAPLVNRATQGLYPPGSTFKILTSLEYIRENPSTYTDYSFNCTGSFTYEGSKIKCYHGEVHGTLDFFGSFAQSCNSSFSNIGLSLNQASFASTLDGMLFNEALPFDLPYSKSVATASDTLAPKDIMQLSIGQGSTTVTPLHMNLITMSIANDGVLMKPYLLDRVESADGRLVDSFEPSQYGQLMTEKESEILTQMMRGVVTDGTASALADADYKAVGKTGSAEYSDGSSDSHAWFTGFAPADDPQICVTVIMEKAGSGGHMAVPVAKRIFDEYFSVNAVN